MQQLREAYLEIMCDVPVEFLDKRLSASKPVSELAGAFLPSVSQAYLDAPNRIMIVGRETRGWKVKEQGAGEAFDLSSYVEAAMAKHQAFFENQLSGKATKGRAFHNFTRRVANRSGKGLLYSNLFCFSWKGKSPQKHPEYKTIARVSKRILDAQIEILKPDTVIFCNGVSSAGARRAFFPISGENAVCTDSRFYPGHKNDHLWEFTLYGKIRCFRVPHPSAYTRKAALAHSFLIDNLLPPHNGLA